jgi:hypothetical protein
MTGSNGTATRGGLLLPATVLGLYCADAEYRELLDYLPLDGPDAVAGSVRSGLFVANVRCALEWRLLRLAPAVQSQQGVGAPAWDVELHARSNRLAHDDSVWGTLPYAIRLSYGPVPQTGMWVQWTSQSQGYAPQLLLGSAPGQYPSAPLVGNSTTYGAADLCGAPANISFITNYIFPGYFHAVLAEGLQPNTTYYYKVGQNGTWSPEFRFVTALPLGRDVPTRFSMSADMALSFVGGALSTVWNTRERVLTAYPVVNASAGMPSALPVAFTALTGDLGYAMGTGFLWDAWMAYVEPLSAVNPFQITVGNHEYDHISVCANGDPSGAAGNGWHPSFGDLGDDSGGEGGIPVFFRFKGMGTGNGNGPYWYSFDVGSVHFVHWSSEHDFTPGSPQYRWLEQDLGAVDRSVTPWIITAQHRPMATPENEGAHWFGLAMSRYLEPLFYSKGVRLNLAGHIHNWLTTCPMLNMTCLQPNTDGTQNGIVYATIGSAGASIETDTIITNETGLIQSYILEWGMGIITAYNRSALLLEFITNSDNETRDYMWIRQ